MKLSISNIGWDATNDSRVYELMKKYCYNGLEIAPTRIFLQAPYSDLSKAKAWSDYIKKQYGFVVPSMQSIWYGRQELIFGSSEERKILLEYTKKAIDFAEITGCGNLVFGCPKNRFFPKDGCYEIGVEFFREIGEYAFAHNTVVGMEANPPIYNTNYINDTLSAIELIKKVNSQGFKLNLDIGTMIYNNESADELIGNVRYINHVHISEPGLKTIEKRPLHLQIKELLFKENYSGFISIEMSKQDDVAIVEQVLMYVSDIFNN